MLDKIKTALAMIGSLILAGLAIWSRGRASGKAEAMTQAKQEDQVNALEIEKRADAARRRPIDDPVSVLRKAGRLRD